MSREAAGMEQHFSHILNDQVMRNGVNQGKNQPGMADSGNCDDICRDLFFVAEVR